MSWPHPVTSFKPEPAITLLLRLLSDMKITSPSTLYTAVQKIHKLYQVPHVIVTSVRFEEEEEDHNQNSTESPPIHTKGDIHSTDNDNKTSSKTSSTITVVGSTARSDHTARAFRIDVPAFPLFFSGTGDMFAALTVYRFREEVRAAATKDAATGVRKEDQSDCYRYASDDSVSDAAELPLARAVEKVLASMHAMLKKTADYATSRIEEREKSRDALAADSRARSDGLQTVDMGLHLSRTKDTEIRVLQGVEDLRHPPELEKFRAREFTGK